MANWVSTIPDPFGTCEGKADDKGHVEYTRVFMVLFDGPQPDAQAAGGAPGIPTIFSPYPSDFRARAKEVTPKQRSDDPSVYDVTVKFGSITEDERQKQDNPLAKPPRVTWGHTQFQNIVEQAYLVTNGNKADSLSSICNSAGVPFDPPQEADASRLSLSVIYNLPFVPTWILDYQDAVNENDITIEGVSFAARTLKCNVSVSEWMVENDVTYRQVTLQLQARQETWDIQIVDRGFSQLVNTTTLEPLTDDDGNRLDKPALLNGGGGKLVQNGTPVYRVYRHYTEKDYSDLNLPP